MGVDPTSVRPTLCKSDITCKYVTVIQYIIYVDNVIYIIQQLLHFHWCWPKMKKLVENYLLIIPYDTDSTIVNWTKFATRT